MNALFVKNIYVLNLLGICSRYIFCHATRESATDIPGTRTQAVVRARDRDLSRERFSDAIVEQPWPDRGEQHQSGDEGSDSCVQQRYRYGVSGTGKLKPTLNCSGQHAGIL